MTLKPHGQYEFVLIMYSQLRQDWQLSQVSHVRADLVKLVAIIALFGNWGPFVKISVTGWRG